MMDRFKRWLSPPIFQGQADKTFRARLHHIALLSCIGCLVIVMFGNWLGGRTPAVVVGMDALIVLICLLFYRWTRQGRLGLAGVGLMTLGIVAITLTSASLGTIRTPTTMAFLLLVIVAGLLFERRGFAVMTILSSLAILGLIGAENAGLLPAPDLSVTLTQWVTYTAFFGASGALTIWVLRSTRQALERAESENAAHARAEAALRESAHSLARAQRIGNLGNWDWDVNGNALVWSDEVYRIWGVDKGFPLTFDNIVRMIHPDDREANQEALQELFASRNEGAFEFRICCPDGTIKHIYQSIEVTCAPSGQVSRMFGIMQDITARKRAEAALRESEEKYRTLFTEMSNGFALNEIVFDSLGSPVDYVTLEVNPVFEFLLNAPREAIVGKKS
jgi:PAS domain S-box-containing protein